MKTGLVVLLSALCVLGPAPAAADSERSTGWAYAAGAAGVLVPGWIGTALIPGTEDDRGIGARDVAAMTGLYAALAWGTSAGYLYSGNTRYALIGGLGKTALLGGAIGASVAFEADGHPYLMAMGVSLALTWSIVDYALLYRDVRRQNERRAGALLSAPGGRGITPAVSLSNDGLGLSLSGRF